MLEAIGMTGKQLKKMLAFEGGLYVAVSAVFTLTVGNLMCYAFVMAISNQMWFFTYHFTAVPIIFTLALLGIISVLLPVICYNKMCGDSIADRLRISE